MSNQQPAHNFRPYGLEVCHLGCDHDFNPADFTTSILSFTPECWQPGHPNIRWVTQPRWCRECAEWRSQAINMSYERRLAVKPPPTGDREQWEKDWIQWQFLKGVRDGRVYALCRPLEESKTIGADEINDPFEYVNEIEKELETMGLDEKKDGTDVELAAMMKEVGIERDLLVEESERTSNEMQAYDQGVKAGRGVQALFESQALKCESHEVRKIMFEQALL